MIVGKLMVAVISFLVVPWIIQAMAGGKVRARSLGTARVCEYGTLMVGSCWIGFVFFTVLAGLAWTYPGRTPPSQIGIVLAIFLGFSTFSLLTLALLSRSVVLWTDSWVEGADMLGARHRLGWSDLERVEWWPAASCVRLGGKDRGAIWVSPWMRGFRDFWADLARHCADRGLPVPVLPEQP